MRLISLLCFVFLFNNATAQDVQFAQSIIDTLSSPYFDGRGYVNNGQQRAAEYIFKEMNSIGLKSVQYHNIKLNVNTFPGKLKVCTNERDLIPGIDYLVDPASASVKLKPSKLIWIDASYFINQENFKTLLNSNFSKHIVIVDTIPANDSMAKRRNEYINNFRGKCLVEIKKDLTWSVARNQEKAAHLWILPGILNSAQTLEVRIEARFIENYAAQNVLGSMRGTEHPDSIIIITGHYDHLGRMGAATFMPGANDNASGIAMILDLAKYYVAHPPKFTLQFIAFAAEEAGLVGSYYFVQDFNKYIDKNKVKFLINMDLMGSGDEGIMAVNGKVFTSEFNLLEQINKENNYLSVVKSRGKAANSDHYFFTEMGIHGFFFYLMGKYAYYHDVEDSRENLRLSAASYNSSFRLIRGFMEVLMGKDV